MLVCFNNVLSRDSNKIKILSCRFFFFFFYPGFLSRTFTNHRTAGEGRGHFLNSSLSLPPVSLTLTHQPGDCCRELTQLAAGLEPGNFGSRAQVAKTFLVKNISLNIESNLFKRKSIIWTTLYSIVSFQCQFQTLYSVFFTNERNGTKTFRLKSKKKGLFRELPIQ